MKFLNLLFFTKALMLIAILGFTPIGHQTTVVDVGTECVPTPYAWRENVSPESFDLFWAKMKGGS